MFLNGTTCGKDEQVDYFVQNGVISFFMDVIYDDDKYKETFDALEFIQVFFVFLEVYWVAGWRSASKA